MRKDRVRVGEIATQVRGVTYSKGDAIPMLEDGYLPLLRAGNITETGLSKDDLLFVPKSHVSLKQRLQRGDVLIAASSGSLSTVGKAAQAKEADSEATFGAFCKVLRLNPNSGVDEGYFGHYFQTSEYRSIVSDLAAGANINNLRSEHLDNLSIFPPRH